MAQDGHVVWASGGPQERLRGALWVVAKVAVAGCRRGASVARGEGSSLTAVGGPLAVGCSVSGSLLALNACVWPRVVTWYDWGVPGCQCGHVVWARGGLGPRPQVGLGAVAKVAVLSGLRGGPLCLEGEGSSRAAVGAHWLVVAVCWRCASEG